MQSKLGLIKVNKNPRTNGDMSKRHGVNKVASTGQIWDNLSINNHYDGNRVVILNENLSLIDNFLNTLVP